MNTHKHKCDNCDAVWEHADSCGGFLTLLSDAEVSAAHTCPNCGEYQSWKYHGDDAVTFIFGGTRCDERMSLDAQSVR